MRIVKVVVNGQVELAEGVYWGPRDTVTVHFPSSAEPYWEICIQRSDGRKEVIAADGRITVMWEEDGGGSSLE